MRLGLGFCALGLMAALSATPGAAQENQCLTEAVGILRAAHPEAVPVDDSADLYRIGDQQLRISRDRSVFTQHPVMVCRYWPGRPGTLLVAIPLIDQDLEGSNVALTGDVELYAMEASSWQIEARLLLPDFIQSDAINFDRIYFDTAHYDLVDGRRAFGLRSDYTGASRVNPYSRTDLSLFDLHEGKLSLILADLVVAQSNGEWDGNCTGEHDHTGRVLDVGPGTYNSASDIRVLTQVSHDSSRDTGDDCTTTTTETDLPETVLKYNGLHYPVPEDLAAPW
ncbi:MAG: hypothetical protein ACK5LJ_00530 [Paracoccus sp. (in: a-proteobacteria)]